eukprot:CAMPEP_0195101090 /NCGR_PEP_ID=MMETSP0448-20130528/64905_1 /TAXON_ID=66468 /ORGANISM="Heterocapsa triquestra, Strain CCMP 448" /LENGTH=43 /DNA_ID= /DNA_START= /DNA_END= /DNA_ORIENTATION=
MPPDSLRPSWPQAATLLARRPHRLPDRPATALGAVMRRVWGAR